MGMVLVSGSARRLARGSLGLGRAATMDESVVLVWQGSLPTFLRLASSLLRFLSPFSSQCSPTITVFSDLAALLLHGAALSSRRLSAIIIDNSNRRLFLNPLSSIIIQSVQK